MAAGRRPSTDAGTAVIHAILVVSFVALLLTGLRIASDDPAARWVGFLDPVLPTEHLWFRHLVAAMVFSSVLVAYSVYMVRSRLVSRIQLDVSRITALTRGGAGRWKSCSIVVLWALFVTFATLLVTGVLLFLDAGGLALKIHLFAAWFAVGLVALHVVLHWAAGGLPQLLRIVRLAPLKIVPPEPDFAELLAEHLSRQEVQRAKPSSPSPDHQRQAATRQQSMSLHAHPLISALIAAVAFIAFAAGFERTTRPSLQLSRIAADRAPKVDGDLSDPAWVTADPVTVVTTQGGDFGGGGQSTIEVRALNDGEFAYFAFVWTDPTRSLKHLPLVKTKTGWAIVATDSSGANENQFHEDKFSVLVSQPAFPLIGDAIHLSPAPLKDKPASATRRGLHYTPNGSIADVWVWRASHEGAQGHIDNYHFGGPAKPTADQNDGRRRYTGGFAADPFPPAHFRNVEVKRSDFVDNSGQGDRTVPKRLPRNLAEALRLLGRVSDSPTESESEGARWWLSEAESLPYSEARDREIPVGAVIPGVVMRSDLNADPSGLQGRARWASGRWTLEIVRRLRATSRFDVSLADGTLIWLAAFDHSQSRHTRHLRPFILEVE